jgi:DHA2 family multidrug resistance protein
MLDTIITRREQFHDFEIGEYINEYRPVVHERVQSLANTFMSKGYDAVTAKRQALALGQAPNECDRRSSKRRGRLLAL